MLPELPRRIECFDISHIQGAETVASLVVWEDGQMNKQAYRKFKVKTVAGVDDFAAMKERNLQPPITQLRKNSMIARKRQGTTSVVPKTPQKRCGLVGMGFNPSIYPLREKPRRNPKPSPR